jgi:hypothetical protein
MSVLEVVGHRGLEPSMITTLRWRLFPNPCSRAPLVYRRAATPLRGENGTASAQSSRPRDRYGCGVGAADGSCRIPLADTADACYCAIEFSLREVQQGVLAGAGLFL